MGRVLNCKKVYTLRTISVNCVFCLFILFVVLIRHFDLFFLLSKQISNHEDNRRIWLKDSIEIDKIVLSKNKIKNYRIGAWKMGIGKRRQ